MSTDVRIQRHKFRDGREGTRVVVMIGLVGPLVTICEGTDNLARTNAIAEMELVLLDALDAVRALIE